MILRTITTTFNDIYAIVTNIIDSLYFEEFNVKVATIIFRSYCVKWTFRKKRTFLLKEIYKLFAQY